MSKRIALIVVGRFTEKWTALSPTQQNDFVARVGKTTSTLGLESIAGYRLSSAPGAFITVWEGSTQESVERAIKNLEALGYTQYIDARWMLGERELARE